MQTLYIEQPKQQKYLYFFLGAMIGFQGILNLVKEEAGFSFWFGIFQIAFAVLCVLYAYSILKPKLINSPRIHLGEEDITLHKGLGFSKPKTISHSNIKLIQLKPERLTVITTEYDFEHSIDYQGINQKEIADKISDYAKAQNLPIEHIIYRNV